MDERSENEAVEEITFSGDGYEQQELPVSLGA